ncbi:MAG: DUF885 domain-containing protein [Nannocystaceae bacterium]
MLHRRAPSLVSLVPLVSLAVLLLASASACKRTPDGAQPPGDGAGVDPAASAPAIDPTLAAALDEAEAGVDDPKLRALLRRDWQEHLERSPLEATRLGVHAFDDKIRITTRETLAADAALRRELLQEVLAFDVAALSDRDRVTLQILRGDLEAAIAGESCEFSTWLLYPAQSPVTRWNYLPELQPVATPEEGERLLARYRAIPADIRASLALYREGLAAGRVTTAESARRVLKQLDDQLAQPVGEWPLVAPARAERPGWSADARAAFSKGITEAVEGEIRPALVEFRDFVQGEVIPKARDDARSGVGHLPGGNACYRSQVRVYTSRERDPVQVHKFGLEEVERINAEMRRLGKRLLGTDRMPEILARLRDDPKLYFDSADAVEAAAQAGLDAARAKIPGYFGILPKAPCVVRRIPEYEAPYTHIGYYRHPSPDGSKPGEYFINTYKPETRPRFEARVLAIHESIPGHHLQLAIAQELPATPAFRKHAEQNVFVEGWALYTEFLAIEMGLYDGDLDEMGRLSFAAWRASRLVVDTGVHAMGWSREQARRYMADHTALALGNIDNEVDRYVNWPGQALGYKLGEVEIRRLRGEAEAALGKGFDLKEFHDVILGGGPMPMDVLEAQVGLWINAKAGQAAGG